MTHSAIASILWVGICTANVPGQVQMVSVSTSGEQANAHCFGGKLSADGQFYLFTTTSTNLVENDANGTLSDVFLRDIDKQQTILVSVNAQGVQGNFGSATAVLSAGGRYAVFRSLATNMPGLVGNAYLRDLETGITELASVTGSGSAFSLAATPAHVSSDGRFVSIFSHAAGVVAQPYSSPQFFLRDRLRQTTSIVSINSQGGPAQTYEDGLRGGSISDDGRYFVFGNVGDDLAPGTPFGYFNVYLHDRQTTQTSLMTITVNGLPIDGTCLNMMIARYGRFIVFDSEATNIVENDTNGVGDVFVRDLLTQQTRRVSVSSEGEQADGASQVRAVSADGRFIAFFSAASNLVPDDTNGAIDGFVHDQWTGTTERATLNWKGEQINGQAVITDVSDDGRIVGINSSVQGIVPEPVNGFLLCTSASAGNSAMSIAMAW